MRIEHIAIWVRDIERMKQFYCRYFKMNSSVLYKNNARKFSSYFLSFEGSTEARIELMHVEGAGDFSPNTAAHFGYAHIAISAGTADAVNMLTETLRAHGYTIAGEPRTTGDGYYESIVLDPEGNRIEITV